MTWHVPIDALRGYESGRIEPTQQLSIEAHLTSCVSCRLDLAGLVDGAVLQRTWDAIAAETSAPRPGVIERLLLVMGISDHSARLVAATPSLRRSWLLAVAAVLSLGVLVANGAVGGYAFFLALAPLLPLAGIAAAYGPGIDPTYEIGIAAPMRSFRLLLIRAIAVLVSTIALASVAALFLPGLDWRAGAWLLPALALSAACLALATIVQPLRAAVIVGGAWSAVVAGATAATPAELAAQSVFGARLQIAVLVVGIGSALVLVARREQLERGEGQ
jgi:hypothetical protein